MDSGNTPRRFHSKELKARVLAACAEPGASVAAVAQAHGLNANLVHKWRRQYRDGVALPAPLALAPPSQPSGMGRLVADATQAFVAVQLPTPANVPADIRLELQRGAAKAVVTWPLQEASACGAWLREWLR
jgi:transposase